MVAELPDQYLLHIQKDILIRASVSDVFESLLEQIGPGMTTPDGTAMPLTLEAWPGGRWFRDTGNNTGHFWGHVQVIKPPKLLEIVGPMFMSFPVASHVQYKISEEGSETRLTMLHRAIGDIAPEHRAGMDKGWEYILAGIRKRALA